LADRHRPRGNGPLRALDEIEFRVEDIVQGNAAAIQTGCCNQELSEVPGFSDSGSSVTRQYVCISGNDICRAHQTQKRRRWEFRRLRYG
jgi:hypothetical protein